METTQTKTKKRTGPVKTLETMRTNVLLEPELVEWAKHQRGGLSGTVRRLLREERVRQNGNGAKHKDAENDNWFYKGVAETEEERAELRAALLRSFAEGKANQTTPHEETMRELRALVAAAEAAGAAK